MIKKISLIIFLLFMVISCGKKNDPKYVNPKNKVEIQKASINLA